MTLSKHPELESLVKESLTDCMAVADELPGVGEP